MPKRRAKEARQNRKLTSRSTKRKRKSTRRQQRNPQLGQHVATATRAVLAQLPGSSITQPLADFVFNLFGVSNSNIDTQGAVTATETSVVYACGMFGAFNILPRMFMGEDPRIGSIYPSGNYQDLAGLPYYFNPAVKYIGTQFTQARMLRLSVTAECTGPPGSVSGMWTMGFVPYRTPEDQTEFVGQLKTYGCFEYISVLPRSVIGPVTESLTLTYKFKATDFRASMPGPLDNTVGIVVLAYEDVMRSSGSNFSAEDFQCSVKCDARVEFLSRDPSAGWVIANTSFDPLDDISAVIRAPNGLFCFGKTAKLTNSRGSVTVTGVVKKVKEHRTMAPYPAGGPKFSDNAFVFAGEDYVMC